jgi:hypothetical protein
MKVYALYDERRDERGPLEAELKRQGIEAELRAAILAHGETPEASISWNHKALVALARKLKLPEVGILEADVLFPHPKGWQYFLDQKPDEYDLYLGGYYDPGNWHGVLRPDQDAWPMLAVDRPNGFHCYCVHERYYDRFLATPADAHIDDAQHGGSFILCYPIPAIQRPGWSANAKEKVNYNHKFDSRPGDVYGWEYYKHSDYPIT